MSSKDLALFTANTSKNPSPVLMYYNGDKKSRRDLFSQNHNALGPPQVYLIAHGRVFFLTGSVEDVKEARLAVNDNLLAIRVLYGGVVLVHEMVLDQLDCQGALADAAGCGDNHWISFRGPTKGLASLETVGAAQNWSGEPRDRT